VLAGGGTALALLRGSGPRGAADPESAATQFFDALGSKNVPNILGMLSPSEVDLITLGIETADLPTPSASPDAAMVEAYKGLWNGVTFETTNLAVAPVAIANGVERVELTDGSLSLDIDPDAIQDVLVALSGSQASSSILGSMGGFAGESLMGPDTIDEMASELAAQLPLTTTAADMADQLGFTPFVVAVEENGKWFMSPTMTFAEYAFMAAEQDNPGLTRGNTLSEAERLTFGSPEEAAQGLSDAVSATIATGDLRELAKALTEAESRILAVYGPAITGESAGPLPLQINDLRFSAVEQKGDWARMGLEAFDLSTEDGETVRVTREPPDRYVAAIEPSYDEGNRLTASLEATGTERWLIDFDAAFYGGATAGSIQISMDPERLAVDVTMSNDGEPSTDMHFTVDDQCLDIEDRIDSWNNGKICASDFGMSQLFETIGQVRDALPGLPRPERLLAVTAVNVDGSWKVSLVDSVADLVWALTAK
jgi:hypothetical protein